MYRGFPDGLSRYSPCSIYYIRKLSVHLALIHNLKLISDNVQWESVSLNIEKTSRREQISIKWWLQIEVEFPVWAALTFQRGNKKDQIFSTKQPPMMQLLLTSRRSTQHHPSSSSLNIFSKRPSLTSQQIQKHLLFCFFIIFYNHYVNL